MGPETPPNTLSILAIVRVIFASKRSVIGWARSFVVSNEVGKGRLLTQFSKEN